MGTQHKHYFAMSIRAELRWVTKWQEVQGAAGWVCVCVCGEGVRLALLQRRSQALNTEARQRGGPALKWCFIFAASTLSCLHPGSGSRLWGLPLIPLDPPLSPLIPPWAPVLSHFLSYSRSFHHFLCCLCTLSSLFYIILVFCSCWRTQKKNESALFYSPVQFPLSSFQHFSRVTWLDCSAAKMKLMWSHFGCCPSLFRFHTAPSDNLWRYASASFPWIVGEQFWGPHVVVQAVKIWLGMKLTRVRLKRCISWICQSGFPPM